MTDVKYPQMRQEAASALAALADPEYQRRVWIDRKYPRDDFYDDLTLNVNILYDMVLPDPKSRIGTVLTSEKEANHLIRLEEVLGPLIAELRDAPDSRYLADPRWKEVVAAASSALSSMELAGD